MLRSRAEISRDKYFGPLTDAILERDQPRTTDLFFQMVARDGRSIGDALAVVTAAEAPFVQVPSHINIRDGQVSLINNDHTILGLRAAACLMPYLPEKYRLLPLLQSVWYIPAGLDIWNQLLGKYPGRYATMKGLDVPPPEYGPVVWHEDHAPIRAPGTAEERLHAHMIATVSGDSGRSYGLFLGMAEDPEMRPRLRDQLEFLGLIDLQDTVVGRKARNTGHKAIRARAVTDLAEIVGWDQAHGVYYMGVPDMAVGPLYYSLYDAVCVRLAAEFPEDAGKGLAHRNSAALAPAEVEDMVEQLMTADSGAVWDLLTVHLKSGKSIRSLGDTLQLGAAELILRTTVPRQFTNGQHPFDYCNVANNWLRRGGSPYQPRILYLMASFINDVAHENKLYRSVLEEERGTFDVAGARRKHCSARSTTPSWRSTFRARPRVPTLISNRAPTAGRIWRPSRCAPAGFRTTRTTRRSRSRPSRSMRTTRPICATGCCWRRRGCWRAGSRCPASATATPASCASGSAIDPRDYARLCGMVRRRQIIRRSGLTVWSRDLYS